MHIEQESFERLYPVTPSKEPRAARLARLGSARQQECAEPVAAAPEPDDPPIRTKKFLTVNLVVREVVRFYRTSLPHWGITPKDIVSDRRDNPVIIPRFVVCYIMREKAKWSLIHIGRELKRDHSSIHNACNRVVNGGDTELIDEAEYIWNTIIHLNTAGHEYPLCDDFSFLRPGAWGGRWTPEIDTRLAQLFDADTRWFRRSARIANVLNREFHTGFSQRAISTRLQKLRRDAATAGRIVAEAS